MKYHLIKLNLYTLSLLILGCFSPKPTADEKNRFVSREEAEKILAENPNSKEAKLFLLEDWKKETEADQALLEEQRKSFILPMEGGSFGRYQPLPWPENVFPTVLKNQKEVSNKLEKLELSDRVKHSIGVLCERRLPFDIMIPDSFNVKRTNLAIMIICDITESDNVYQFIIKTDTSGQRTSEDKQIKTPNQGMDPTR